MRNGISDHLNYITGENLASTLSAVAWAERPLRTGALHDGHLTRQRG